MLDRLAADYLDRAGVDNGSMFGSTGLRAGGKFFAFVGAEGGLIVKVPGARATALVAAGEATPVRIRRNPSREWINVNAPASEQDSRLWPVLLSEAYEYVSRRRQAVMADGHHPAKDAEQPLSASAVRE